MQDQPILVIGSTGKTGHRIAKTLTERGYSVRPGSRNAAVPFDWEKSETWAAALDYTVRKVNLRPIRRRKIAAFYGVSDGAVRDRHNELVRVLDVMPCDYRYFTGKENPLDKLVEAAELLELLEARFQEP